MAVDQVAADTHHRGGRPDPGELDDGEIPGRDAHGVHVGFVLGPVLTGETAGLAVLLGKGLNDADTGQPLLEGGERAADAVPDLQVGPVRVTAELDAGQDHRGQGHERDQGQQRGQIQQQGQGEDHDQGVLDELGQAQLDQVLQGVDVGRHAGDQPSGRLPVEEVHRHGLDVVEDAHAQVAEELLAQAGHEDDLGPGQPEGGDGHAQEAERGAIDGGAAAMARGQAVVDAVGDEAGPGQDRGHRTREHRGGQRR